MASVFWSKFANFWEFLQKFETLRIANMLTLPNAYLITQIWIFARFCEFCKIRKLWQNVAKVRNNRGTNFAPMFCTNQSIDRGINSESVFAPLQRGQHIKKHGTKHGKPRRANLTCRSTQNKEHPRTNGAERARLGTCQAGCFSRVPGRRIDKDVST